MTQHILLTGSTGMIGQLVLQLCLDHPDVSQVTSLVRRPTHKSHPKLNEIVVDNFCKLHTIDQALTHIDVVYYCLGVYTGAVPRFEFRKITVDYPTALAKAIKAHNPKVTWCLLSGQGADRTERSKMMFARDKGAIENTLAEYFPDHFYSCRPGYIYPVTPRKEPNTSYAFSRKIYPLLRLLGRRFSIKSTELADVMFHIGLHGADQQVLENADLLAYRSRISSNSSAPT